jgi:hypothetical protein
MMSEEPIPFPWDGINIHMNSKRSNNHAHELLRRSRQVQRTYGDAGSMIVGEWGINFDEDPDDLSDLYGAIIQASYLSGDRYWPDIMFYFSHHHVLDGAGDWGMRWFDVQTFSGVSRFTLNPYSPSPPDQKAFNIRIRYTSIMNPP